MSIRRLIERPSEVREIVVKHKGVEYVVSGRPDATVLAAATLKTEDQRANTAAHLGNVCGGEFDPGMVLQIELVALSLQVREEGEEFNPEARYDVTEIARLSLNEAGLFFKLVGAASEVFGFSDEQGVKEAVAGESESEQEPTGSTEDS